MEMDGNLFEMFLDCAEDEMPHDEENREILNKAVEKLSGDYSPKKAKTDRGVDMDFDTVELRSAYLYMYATSTCYMVMDVLQKGSAVVRSLIQRVGQDKEQLNVTSLGCGPGSDLAGGLLYLIKTFKGEDLSSVTFNAVDKYGGWESVFTKLMTTMKDKMTSASSTLSSVVQFLRQDFLEPLSEDVRDVLQQTHLLIMVKFFSAVDARKDRTNKCLREVLGLLRTGTLVVLIDNSGGESFPNAHVACKLLNFRDVVNSIDRKTRYRNYQFKIPDEMEPNMKKIYNLYPQKQGGIAYAIMEKR